MLSVSPVSSPLEGVSLLGETSSWGSQFEGPQEVVGFLEVRTYGVDLVDQIFEGSDVVFSKTILDESVVSEGDSLSVDFAIASLVDKSLDGFSGRIPVIKRWVTRR